MNWVERINKYTMYEWMSFVLFDATIISSYAQYMAYVYALLCKHTIRWTGCVQAAAAAAAASYQPSFSFLNICVCFEDKLREFCFFFPFLFCSLTRSHAALVGHFISVLMIATAHMQNFAHFHSWCMHIARILETNSTMVCSGRFVVSAIQCVNFHFQSQFSLPHPG